MEHLSLEALARLVDETPFRSERRHLARCPDCSRELERLREQTEALGSLPDLRPAPGDWPALEARLEREGLLRGSNPADAVIRLIDRRRGWMQAAAALVLFVAGGLAGAVLAPAGWGLQAGGGQVASGEMTEGGVSPAGLTAEEPETPEEAAEVVRLAEQQYRDAMLRYRALTRSPEADTPMDPRRLAVIDAMVAMGQAAVQEAPDDPFLNGFLVSAVAEREAALNALFASADRY
ncbi:MAG: hypothetical protein F4179_10600 [Gammaproteobacteria bacterium]|nr:hypothetical protein [Gammaproteobacteria bacterium]MXY30975.1 hypothetical protein [Gammaproteobacteria bacterium]MYC97974.1 hypothetical protein [Gammaproteobacteria bacterium]MYF62105.1 hypothetical protein [Gammaproteobacteria bacterium]